MFTRQFPFLCFIVSFVYLTGCGQQTPKDIPKLYPAHITVQNGGSPIADTTVFLIPQGGTSGNWSTMGVTNASGVAVITTSQGGWKSNGVPEGTYKVYIRKIPEVHQDPLPDHLKGDPEAMEKHADEYRRLLQNAPKIIPEKLTTPVQSPLTLTVSTSGTAELTVDVSKY